MATKAKKAKGKTAKSIKAKPVKKAAKAVAVKKKAKPVKTAKMNKKINKKKTPAKKPVPVKAKKIIKKPVIKKPVQPKVVQPKVVAKKAVVKAPTPNVMKPKASVAQATVKKKASLTAKRKPPLLRDKMDWSKVDLAKEIPPYQEKPGEEYMNEKQRIHFRHILLQRKQQMLDEMGRVVHHMHDEVATNLPDPNDRATQEEEFSLELRTRDRERKFIKNIEDALQKLDEGEYGYCNACGIEIGVRRLEARPTADLCIDCKTLDELREKQIGSVGVV